MIVFGLEETGMSTIEVPRHVYWSCRGRVLVDASDPVQRNWMLEQVLSNGTMADIQALDLSEIENALPDLRLPRFVRALWRDYFDSRDPESLSQEST